MYTIILPFPHVHIMIIEWVIACTHLCGSSKAQWLSSLCPSPVCAWITSIYIYIYIYILIKNLMHIDGFKLNKFILNISESADANCNILPLYFKALNDMSLFYINCVWYKSENTIKTHRVLSTHRFVETGILLGHATRLSCKS